MREKNFIIVEEFNCQIDEIEFKDTENSPEHN